MFAATMLAMRAFLSHLLLPVATAFAVFLLANGMAKAAEPPVHECDRLTRHPEDRQGADVPGVAFETIDTDAAIAACTEALEKYPDTPRFKYQLGRAIHADGDAAAALPLYEEAAFDRHLIAVYIAYGEYSKAFNESGETDESARLKTLELMRFGAEALDDPWFQFELGRLLIGGVVVERDVDAGLRLIEAAANSEHPKAAAALGYIYQTGEFADQNYDEAFVWYRRAADLGEDIAIQTLDLLYGQVLTNSFYAFLLPGTAFDKTVAPINKYRRSDEEALRWIQDRAEDGDTESLELLALYSEEGFLVSKDRQKAIELYKRAIEAGSKTAKRQLEKMMSEENE
ncbi:MAG: tetratricopeptide repeat protein [Rhodospirillales bacterium]